MVSNKIVPFKFTFIVLLLFTACNNNSNRVQTEKVGYIRKTKIEINNFVTLENAILSKKPILVFFYAYSGATSTPAHSWSGLSNIENTKIINDNFAFVGLNISNPKLVPIKNRRDSIALGVKNTNFLINQFNTNGHPLLALYSKDGKTIISSTLKLDIYNDKVVLEFLKEGLKKWKA